ncbi:MAG TPA: alpha/beta hydrolase [Mycobacteriales bacterium]|nr:alpha/beta hydrolase [Mycobacteriales bacterium]
MRKGCDRVHELTEVKADDGVRLCVQHWPASSDDAPVVLGLHGLSSNRLAFAALARELAGAAHVVAFDCRGRGRSDHPDDEAAYGMRRHADDAAAVLSACDIDAAIVVGQSMGAWIGMQLAAHHPERVRSLVLVDGGWFGPLPASEDPQAFADRITGGLLSRLPLVYPSVELVMGAFRQVPAFAESWDELLDAQLRESLEELPDGTCRARTSEVGVRSDCDSYFTPRDAPYCNTDASLVRCPVRLLRAERGFDAGPGTEEPLLPLDAVAGLQAAVPQVAVTTLPGTTHYSINLGHAGTRAMAAAVRDAAG